MLLLFPGRTVRKTAVCARERLPYVGSRYLSTRLASSDAGEGVSVSAAAGDSVCCVTFRYRSTRNYKMK